MTIKFYSKNNVIRGLTAQPSSLLFRRLAKLIALLILNIAYNNSLTAQKINTIQYTVEDGLIWVATDKGLARYNGYDFKNFTIQDGLPSNDVWGMKEDKEGRLWLSTFNKITYFENDQFHTFSLQDSLALQAPMLQEYWIGEEEVYVLANENNTNYFLEINIRDSTQNLVRKDFEYVGYLGHHKHRKWFLHFPIKGIPYIYYVEDGQTKEIPYINLETSPTSVVNRKFLVRGQYIYFFSKEAIWQFDFQQLKKIPIASILGKETIIEDVFPSNDPNKNLILLKTNKGFQILGDSLEVLPLLNETDNFYKSILEDSNGNIWLGATNGLFLITTNSRHSQYFSLSDDINNNNCTALFVDSSNNIWAANQENTLWKIEESQVKQVQLVQKKFTSIPLKYLFQWQDFVLAAGDFGIFLLPNDPFEKPVIERSVFDIYFLFLKNADANCKPSICNATYSLRVS